ncbi:MAG: pyridoxamine 5'-phosphate oxidase family protein [Planctomycetota bacterium]
MSNPDQFAPTDLTRVRRVPKRASYDRPTIHEILDRAWFCHVGFIEEGRPFVIPMVHGRDGDQLLFHGSPKSRALQQLSSGAEISVAATLFDGLVIARSMFHHSMNYRSVVGFGTGQAVTSDDEKLAALRLFSDRVVPDRWPTARPPSAKELAATAVASVTLHAASAKRRSGPPIDDAKDYQGPYWAGVVHYRETPTALDPDPKLAADIAVPDCVSTLLDGAR